MSRAPSVHAFFDQPTSTLTYVVWDPVSRDAVVIDPVLDFDPATQIVSGESAARLLRFVRAEGMRVHWVLDTHAHADHLSASCELRRAGWFPVWGVGERMFEVFATFAKTFAWPGGLSLSALGVDRFFRDGEEFTAGTLRLRAISTPGHTPACVSFLVGEKDLFVGDTLFMPDSGVGRCDFPGGSASALWDSVWGRLYALDDSVRVWTGHDYQPGGRPLRFLSTVGKQKLSNIHLRSSTSRADFAAFREARDKTLSAPRLLAPSLDWNLGAHQLVKRPQGFHLSP